jgi:hypothetical protein
MELIKSRLELDDNISTLKEYLEGAGVDREFAISLIERGICFVVVATEAGELFAPSRFAGYRNNDSHQHTSTRPRGDILRRA